MNEFNEVILLKFGEVVLKGLNRNRFETLMIKDLSSKLKKYGRYVIESRQSILYVIPENQGAIDNFERAVNESTKVFGIAAVSRALKVHKDMSVILECVKTYCSEYLKNAKTFKVEARRSDKEFSLTSPEICRECGGAILSQNPYLSVDVNNPDVTVRIEVRQKHAYINCGAIQGAGGMPYSSAGKGLLLLSGGIDSPVAGYMCAKRGVKLDALHFESYPYTSIQAREKVVELASAMQDTCGKIRLTVASVTEIQEEIKNKCDNDYFTLILRRFMMRIAQRVAVLHNCKAIITGESLGQVASQTMGALNVTNSVVTQMPVFRPLIALDKEEIVKLARKIGTFDISIQPFEDCCTVFTPKHPVTNPILEKITEQENKLDIEGLIDKALSNLLYVEVE